VGAEKWVGDLKIMRTTTDGTVVVISLEWFSVTEADLHLQKKWRYLLEDLAEVRRQQVHYTSTYVDR
jgi:hypothetical protein